MRKNQAISTLGKSLFGKGSSRFLALASGAFLLLLAAGVILAPGPGGILRFGGSSAPAKTLSGEPSRPDASMPNCQDLPARACLLSVNPFDQKLRDDYGQTLGQTQTLANATLRLDWVYADNNYIVVAYSLWHPEGFSFYAGFDNSTLTLGTDNQPLHNNLGISMAGGNDQNIAIIETFDSSTLSQTNGELKLKLSLPEITLEKLPPILLPSQVTPSQPPPPEQELIPAVPTSTSSPADPVAAVMSATEKAAQVQAGPFSLEFTAKLNPARVLQPKVTVKAAAGTATLERIVITPMTERLFFSGLSQEPDIRLNLIAGDDNFRPGTTSDYQTYCRSDPNGLVSCNLEPGTLEKLKDWQIVLRRGVDVPLPTPEPCSGCAPPIPLPIPQFSPTPVVPGEPWIFRLKL